KGHSAAPIPVAFTPDGRTVVSGGFDSTIRLWDVPDGLGARPARLRTTLLGHAAPVTVIAVSPDGITVASTSLDGTVRLWSALPPPLERVLREPEPRGGVNSLALS